MAPGWPATRAAGAALARHWQKGRWFANAQRLYCSASGGTRGSALGFAARHPLLFAVGVATVKTQATDMLVQSSFEKKEQIDWGRVAAFSAFGFAYIGGAQYFVYNKLLPLMFSRAAALPSMRMLDKLKDMRGLSHLAGQVAFDIGVFVPLVHLPVYYVFKEVVVRPRDGSALGAPSCEAPRLMDLACAALETYRSRFVDDFKAALRVWLPSDLLVFGFAPLYLRVPLLCLVSFSWTSVMVLVHAASQVEPAAEEISRVLPGSEELLTKLREVHATFATRSGSRDHNLELDLAGFVRALQVMGVKDRRVAASLFDTMDADGSGRISFLEFSTSLFLLASDVQGPRHIQFLFSSLDIDGNGVVTRPEMVRMLSAILIGRETLLLHSTSDEGIDLMGVMSGRTLEPNVKARAVKREQRLRDLQSRNPRCKGMSVRGCLREEAAALTDAIFDEIPKPPNSDNISFYEFEHWFQKCTPQGRKLARLFDTFSVHG